MDQAKVQLFLLIILALGKTAPGIEGCACLPPQFQDIFCNSQIVIHAKIIEQKVVSLREETIAYEIELIEMFKGYDKVDTMEYIYTPVEESLCGIQLNVGDQYLISGNMENDGKIFVTLCDIHYNIQA